MQCTMHLSQQTRQPSPSYSRAIAASTCTWMLARMSAFSCENYTSLPSTQRPSIRTQPLQNTLRPTGLVVCARLAGGRCLRRAASAAGGAPEQQLEDVAQLSSNPASRPATAQQSSCGVDEEAPDEAPEGDGAAGRAARLPRRAPPVCGT